MLVLIRRWSHPDGIQSTQMVPAQRGGFGFMKATVQASLVSDQAKQCLASSVPWECSAHPALLRDMGGAALAA